MPSAASARETLVRVSAAATVTGQYATCPCNVTAVAAVCSPNYLELRSQICVVIVGV